jgi:hypothetical protein
MRHFRLLALVAGLCFGVASSAVAAVTPEQRKELAEISQAVGDASKLIRKKQVDEAEKAVVDAEERLKAVIAAGVPESEKLVGIIQKNIELRRRAIALQRGERPKNLGVSFSDDVAPIISSRCLDCHGANDPRGGLRLDTFGGWERGGASRQPLAAVLLPRLTANGAQRMPKGREPLTQFQIESITKWLREGGKFDGRAKDAPIGEKVEEAGEKPTVATPAGGETVSFVNDVAPFMVNICGRCHMGNNPRGGFNMTTFEGVMKGGESGQVIEPGNPDGSRLWLMVSNKEQPRMPPGQLLITRENYDALTTWIKEGAKFDGNDPKRPLRDLVPSAGDMRGKELAKLSPEEFAAHRIEQSEAHWKKAFPKEQSAHVETDQFLVYGNVPAERLKQVAAWADEQAASLRSMFAAQDDPLWKGKLTVFVTKDRFGYEEFALAVNNRPEVPPTVHGHAIVTPDYDDAYVVLEDVGDAPSEASPGVQALLASLVTQAYLSREDSKLPDWAVQGTGLHIAAKTSEGNPYFAALRSEVAETIKDAKDPQQLFADGSLPPDKADAVGYALVDFLVLNGGPAKYAQFLSRLAGSGDVAAAAQAVYRTTPAALATGFAQNAAKRRGR